MDDKGHKTLNELVKEGIALCKKNDLSGALERFWQALVLDPSCGEAAKGIAFTFNLAGERNMADKFTRHALALGKHDPHLLKLMASQPLNDGDMDTLIQTFAAASGLVLKNSSNFLDLKAADLELVRALAEFLWSAGRFNEALGVLSIIYKIKSAFIDHVALERNSPKRALCYYFGGSTDCTFGGFSWAMDILVKAIKLGMLPSIEYFFLVHEGVKFNKAIIDFWSKYINVVKNKEEIDDLIRIYGNCELPPLFLPEEGADGYYAREAWHEVNRRWSETGRPPLLSLDEEELQKGREFLRNLGIPKDAWFVGIHVRESGFYGDDGRSFSDLRNVRIDDYMGAIGKIVERGGWVIRMGDSSMTPLKPMDHFVDYANSSAKSEWMDVFLCAACRFFIGTDSGPVMIPQTFGRPTIQTNMVPIHDLATMDTDLFIHQTLYRVEDETSLPLQETFNPPFINNHNARILEKLGVWIRPNTPEEITDVTLEMIESLDGGITYDKEDEDLFQGYSQIPIPRVYRSLGRPGRLFLRNNRHLF